MELDKKSQTWQLPKGCVLAPIHSRGGGDLLKICVLMRVDPQFPAGPFVMLRELPEARVFLGAVCDVEGIIQEWVEIWVQTLEVRDLAYSGYQERLSNVDCDKRWRAEWLAFKENQPESVITTGLEQINPAPMLVKLDAAGTAVVDVEVSKWVICKDDALLESFGLPQYSLSPYRYLHNPAADGAKVFLATSKDAPANSHVKNSGPMESSSGGFLVFNPHAGLIRVTRFKPMETEEYLQILEGQQWSGPAPAGMPLFLNKKYMELQSWSSSPKGLPFMLHGGGNQSDRLNEIFFLKLSVLHAMFKEVRHYVKARQLPLLNLSPSSFRLDIPEVGAQFPALWATHCALVKPGQAYPLQIRSTEQKYFIRLGRVEPSPFLPESLGANSSGSGSVRIRNVTTETEGIVLEGTLVAEDYLTVESHDLLWFKLPLGEERLEFFAHVYKAEAVGPREARFRTVPVKLGESANAALKRVAGTVFAKSPYEIWPLLSSPCDMFSLGIMAVRILLSNGTCSFPVIIDEVLGLSRHLGTQVKNANDILPVFKALVQREQRLFDLVSPHNLIEGKEQPQSARERIHKEIWLDTMGLVLRLFPGAGPHSFCKDFGDVSPLALETIFDRPIQELETLLLRLRSVLTPSLFANEEIANILVSRLAAL